MPSLLKSLSTLFIIFFICDIAILYSISQTADINKPQVILLENVSSLYMNEYGSFIYGTDNGEIVSNGQNYNVESEIKSIYAEMNNTFILASTEDTLYCFFRTLKWKHALKNSQIVGIGRYFKQTLVLTNMVVVSDEGLTVYKRSGDLMWNFPVKGVCDMDNAGYKIVLGADHLYFFEDCNEFLMDYENHENPPYKTYNIQPISLDLNWNGRKLIVLTEDKLIYYEEDEEKWRVPASGKEVSFCDYDNSIVLQDGTGIKIYDLSGNLTYENEGEYIPTHGNYLYKFSENTLYSYSKNKLTWKSTDIPNVLEIFTNDRGDYLLAIGEDRGYYFSQLRSFFPGDRKYWGIFLPFLILQFIIILVLRFHISPEKKEIKFGVILGIISALIGLKYTGFHGQYFIMSGCIGFFGGYVSAKSKGELWGIVIAVGFCAIIGIVVSQILAFYHWVFYLIPSYPGSEAVNYMVNGMGVGLGYGFFSAIVCIFIMRYFEKSI